MEEKNNTIGNSEKPRELSSIIKGVFIFFMITSGLNCITKLATNLMIENTSLGIIMFICELANIYFLYVILQKKSWGLFALFGMLLTRTVVIKICELKPEIANNVCFFSY